MIMQTWKLKNKQKKKKKQKKKQNNNNKQTNKLFLYPLSLICLIDDCRLVSSL